MPTTATFREAIDARREDLIALTQALVRVPTVNPPGENYREICDLIAARMAPQGFAVEIVRAEGTPGDSDRRSWHRTWPRVTTPSASPFKTRRMY
jgi:acetylornithine deacetylase/succinyl-diaminopimelate desuccinylase-like protein